MIASIFFSLSFERPPPTPPTTPTIIGLVSLFYLFRSHFNYEFSHLCFSLICELHRILVSSPLIGLINFGWFVFGFVSSPFLFCFSTPPPLHGLHPDPSAHFLGRPSLHVLYPASSSLYFVLSSPPPALPSATLPVSFALAKHCPLFPSLWSSPLHVWVGAEYLGCLTPSICSTRAHSDARAVMERYKDIILAVAQREISNME